jgi:hypothetical protein
MSTRHPRKIGRKAAEQLLGGSAGPVLSSWPACWLRPRRQDAKASWQARRQRWPRSKRIISSQSRLPGEDR